MSNSQYPVGAVQNFTLPLHTGFDVTKFQPVDGYQENEWNHDVNGNRLNRIAVDGGVTIEVEEVVQPGTEIPLENTAVSFTSVVSAISTHVSAGSLDLLIISPVKRLGDPGKTMKIGYTGFKNDNVP
ncbi:hypothetical protein SAMN05444156_3223 [Verrucomicrobium sp. GAS474]|uniref:hypothetical protein n=1 Tax=Verrucomicrobium sp. GAS474 TaxID=1882831 RepID=UPI00087C9C37|nr:hypothetical protein [Verrucomicrobium sp. GAS474]SDU31139.1 hypothetical protein SAMN05444156_3223 [Verrucomicrobium sp. GAS474]